MAYTIAARIGLSGKGFQAIWWTSPPTFQTLRQRPVSTSQIRTVPSDEPAEK
jgi:hypothetical protein